MKIHQHKWISKKGQNENIPKTEWKAFTMDQLTSSPARNVLREKKEEDIVIRLCANDSRFHRQASVTMYSEIRRFLLPRCSRRRRHCVLSLWLVDTLYFSSVFFFFFLRSALIRFVHFNFHRNTITIKAYGPVCIEKDEQQSQSTHTEWKRKQKIRIKKKERKK